MKPGCGYDFGGVLLRSDKSRDGYHTFADVTVHPPEGQPEKLQGESYILRGDVYMVQTIPAKTNANG